ncbi:HAD family hydrolase [Bacillus sp. AK128]
MIKAIVFDFDGLIVDTESVWFTVFKEAMLEYEYDLQLEEFAISIGTTDDVLFQKLATSVAVPFDPNDIKEKTELLYEKKMNELTLRDGVLDYLQSAKELGLKIGLASSSSRTWVEGFLNQFQIKDYFEVIKTKDDVKKVKPDPELYIQAVSALNVKARETLAFEDSKNGLQAAISAGLHCVVVPNPVTSLLDFEGHLHRVETMDQVGLKDLLNQLNEKIEHRTSGL